VSTSVVRGGGALRRFCARAQETLVMPLLNPCVIHKKCATFISTNTVNFCNVAFSDGIAKEDGIKFTFKYVAAIL